MVGVIISPENDIHAFAVKYEGHQLGYEIEIIDTAEFMDTFDLAAYFSAEGKGRAAISFCQGKTLESSDISGLWWRRPATPRVTHVTQHPGSVNAVRAEASQAIFGSLSATIPNSFNDPARSKVSAQKPLQLGRASTLGFRIPRTLITSQPEAAAQFVSSARKGVIYKTFKGTDLGLFETRPLKVDDLNELWRLKKCPIMLQENIDGDYDVRVTIVGSSVFAARIDFDRTSQIIDSRFTSTSISPIKLPDDLEKSLVSLLMSFGLEYGAVDLRFSKSDGFVFFELNPEGQYLWTEIEAGLQISRTIAQKLVGLT